MTAVNVPFIGVVDDGAPIRSECGVFDFVLSRRQESSGAALHVDRVQVDPAVTLPRKNDLIVRSPEELILGDELPVGAAATFFCTPDGFAFARRNIRNDDGPGRGLADRTK